MGKKRVIQKTEKEIIEETDKIEKKRGKEVLPTSHSGSQKGRIYVSSTYNNTIITLTNARGDVLHWATAGNAGFKGAKKGTSFAASRVAEIILGACEKLRIRTVDIFIKGVGGGRDSSLKFFASKGLNIEKIKDITPLPHNGCRPRKPRRV